MRKEEIKIDLSEEAPNLIEQLYEQSNKVCYDHRFLDKIQKHRVALNRLKADEILCEATHKVLLDKCVKMVFNHIIELNPSTQVTPLGVLR